MKNYKTVIGILLIIMGVIALGCGLILIRMFYTTFDASNNIYDRMTKSILFFSAIGVVLIRMGFLCILMNK